MSGLVVVGIILFALFAFDVLAVLFGADSRDDFTEDRLGSLSA